MILKPIFFRTLGIATTIAVILGSLPGCSDALTRPTPAAQSLPATSAVRPAFSFRHVLPSRDALLSQTRLHQKHARAHLLYNAAPFVAGQMATTFDVLGALQDYVTNFYNQSSNVDYPDFTYTDAIQSFINTQTNFEQYGTQQYYYGYDPSPSYHIMLASIADNYNQYNTNNPQQRPLGLQPYTAITTPVTYGLAGAAMATTAALIAAVIVGIPLSGAIAGALTAGAVVGGIYLVAAALTNAPENELFTDIADASSFGALSGGAIGSAIDGVGLEAGTVTSAKSALSGVAPTLRGLGKFLTGSGGAVVGAVVGTVVGISVYYSQHPPSTQYFNHFYDHDPSPGSNYSGFFVDGSYQVCVSFNGGATGCYLHYY